MPTKPPEHNLKNKDSEEEKNYRNAQREYKNWVS